MGGNDSDLEHNVSFDRMSVANAVETDLTHFGDDGVVTAMSCIEPTVYDSVHETNKLHEQSAFVALSEELQVLKYHEEVVEEQLFNGYCKKQLSASEGGVMDVVVNGVDVDDVATEQEQSSSAAAFAKKFLANKKRKTQIRNYHKQRKSLVCANHASVNVDCESMTERLRTQAFAGNVYLGCLQNFFKSCRRNCCSKRGGAKGCECFRR